MFHKYPAHPDYARVPTLNLRFNAPFIAFINAMFRLQRFFTTRKTPGDLSISTEYIPCSGGHRIKARVIKPRDLDTPAPALVYLHGGAFAMTYAAVHMRLCREYARRARCVVVLVDYRLAPAHPFPAGFDDSYDALNWVRAESARLGIDPGLVAVGGDSAGGALAAGVAQKSLDRQLPPLCGQLLIYPVTDSRCETASVSQLHDAPLWNAPSVRRMWPAYLPGEDLQHPPAYAAPGLRADLRGLAPVYLETAEFDPLRDEGLVYAEALSAAGVDTELNATVGTIHGFEAVADNPLFRDALEKRVVFLQRCFGRARGEAPLALASAA